MPQNIIKIKAFCIILLFGFCHAQSIQNVQIEAAPYSGVCPAQIEIEVQVSTEGYKGENLQYYFETNSGTISENTNLLAPFIQKITAKNYKKIDGSGETNFNAILYINKSTENTQVSFHIKSPEAITSVSAPITVDCWSDNRTPLENEEINTAIVDVALQQECGNALILIGRARPCQDIQIDNFPDYLEANIDKTEFLYPLTFYLNPSLNLPKKTIQIEVYLDNSIEVWATFTVDLSQNQVAFTQDITLPIGQHTLIVMLDTGQIIAESNEFNTFTRTYNLVKNQEDTTLKIDRTCLSLTPPQESVSALNACKPILERIELYLSEGNETAEESPFVLLFGIYATALRDKFPQDTFKISYFIDGQEVQTFDTGFPSLGLSPRLRLDRIQLNLPRGEHQISIEIIENNKTLFKPESRLYYTFDYSLN